MNTNKKLQTPVYELNFPTRIVNVLMRYNIQTIEELVSLSPQDIMKRRNSSPTQAKTVAEKTEAWFDEQGLSKDGYPLFSKDYSNKINGVTIKKAMYQNTPYQPKQISRVELYDELDAILIDRIALTKRIKNTLELDSRAKRTLIKARLDLNQREDVAHKQLMISAKSIDENSLTTYRLNQKIQQAYLIKELSVSIPTIKAYESLANIWINQSRDLPLRHYYLTRIYANTRLNGYFRALGFDEKSFIDFVNETIKPTIHQINMGTASETDKLELFIDVLDLSQIAYSSLVRCRVKTIADLLYNTPLDIASIRTVSDKVYNHITTQLSNWCIEQNITPAQYELFKTTGV